MTLNNLETLETLEGHFKFWKLFTRATLCNRNVSVRLSVSLSVRLPVRHAPVLCQNEDVMISSVHGSPGILVFWRQISSPNSKGFPRTGPTNKGGMGKFSDFLALSVNISKTVADTAKVTISD